MLNSMNLSNGHYSTKIKSMFDLALASSTQRHSISPSLNLYQVDFLSMSNAHQQQQQQNHHHQLLHHQQQNPFNFSETLYDHNNSHLLQNKLKACLTGKRASSGGGHIMEEFSGGGSNSSEIHVMYPRSPQSDSSHKSTSPAGSGDGSRTTSSPIPFNNNNVINSTPPSQQQQSSNVIGMTEDERSTGSKGSTGRNHNNKHSVVKPSFSIDALLAHSTNWRHQHGQTSSHNQGNGGKDGTGIKDNRFFPYHIPQYQTIPSQAQQQQQQHQHQSRLQSRQSSNDNIAPSGAQVSSKSVGGGPVDSDNKRGENFGTTKQLGGSTGSNNGRRPTKSKRVRTIFTPEQLERLEAEFERQQYMVGPERLYLASSLYLTEAQVKVWFQNRRIKWRKQHLEMEQQRLAIYRTLAEQDMMASVEDEEEEEDDQGEGSPECDYDLDESDGVPAAEEEHQRNVQSPAASFPHPNPYHHHHHNPHQTFATNSSPDRPPALHSPPCIRIPSTLIASKNPGSTHHNKPNAKSQHGHLHQQQHSNSEEFEGSPSTTSNSSSCSSYRIVPSLSTTPSSNNNKTDTFHTNAVQGVKN